MKNLLLILTVALALRSPAMDRAQAEALVSAGQRAYAEGDYATALSAFDSAATSYRSAGLCLDLGNTHYKLGDVARAILWYERGLRLAPADADLQANLDLANEQIRDRIPPSGAQALGRTWNLIRGNDPDAWARYSLFACLLLFSALAAAVLTKGGLRQVAWVASAIAALTLLASLLVAAARHAELTSNAEGIIVAAKVEALAEPRDGAKSLFVLHRGVKVSTGNEQEGWCEVRLPNGTAGWMRTALLERI